MVSARWSFFELEIFKADICWYFISFKWTIISSVTKTT
ncbi:hypothetical protein VULLAG_LOCUS17922 [Vulpes lagopus]